MRSPEPQNDRPERSTRVSRIRSETFASLAIPNFRLFFVGQAISQVGNWLTLVAQSLLVLKITGSGVAVGVLTAFQFAPVLILGPWGGLVADRSDKRRLLIVVQAVAMLQSFGLAALAFSDHPSVLGISLVAMVGGVTTAFDNPARRSFVVEMVDEQRVNNAVSLNSALMTGSRVIGPAAAGLLISGVGYGWCFALDGISYIAVILAYLRMDPTKIHASPVAERSAGQVRDGLRYAWSISELRVPLIMMAMVGTFTFNFSVVMPLLVTRTFGGNEVDFTRVFAVISLGSLVGALAVARRQDVALSTVTRAAAAFGISMLGVAVAPTLWALFPIGAIVGVTSIAFITASTAIMQVKADPAYRGRVLALQAMVFLGSTPVGGPILGWICDAFGARIGVAVGGGAALVAALYGTNAASRLKRSAHAS